MFLAFQTNWNTNKNMAAVTSFVVGTFYFYFVGWKSLVFQGLLNYCSVLTAAHRSAKSSGILD